MQLMKVFDNDTFVLLRKKNEARKKSMNDEV